MKHKWLFLLLFLLGLFSLFKFTGMVSHETAVPDQLIPQDELNCMQACVAVGCTEGDAECAHANSERCLIECDAGQPEPADEDEACMQECISVGCEDYDAECQEMNRAECEEKCGMIKEPEAQSEEEQCIRDCVAEINPAIECSSGSALGEGEQGNEVCQRCAEQCEHLYSGPCLNDEEMERKEEACKTCEHCYGEPVMGPSGEGYDCIVDIECMDASSEFGDNPGTGPGITEELEEKGLVNNVVDFFKGLFSF